MWKEVVCDDGGDDGGGGVGYGDGKEEDVSKLVAPLMMLMLLY